MKKPIVAALIALLMTACVGAAMFTIGGAALLNKNGTRATNSADQNLQTVSLNTAQQSDQVAQLQNLVSQYQDREKQYQQREQQLQDQLNQANAQIQSDQQIIQQAQALVQALQERGIIRLSNGKIFLNQ